MESDEYKCTECNGFKFIERNLTILKVCPVCNGKGANDWVERAMGNSFPKIPKPELLKHIALKNIQNLVHEIKRQGEICGVCIDVSLNYNHVSFRPDLSTFMRSNVVIDSTNNNFTQIPLYPNV